MGAKLRIGIVLALLCHVGEGNASELELDWRSENLCPQADLLAPLLDEDRPDMEEQEPLKATVELVSQEDGYRLEFHSRYRDVEIRRQLKVYSCEEARRATVLLIQLLLDTRNESTPPPPDADTSGDPPSLPNPPAVQEKAVQAKRADYGGEHRVPRAWRPTPFVRAGLLFDLANLNQSASGPDLAFGIGSKRWDIELDVHYLPGRREKYEREATSSSTEAEVFSRSSLLGVAARARWLSHFEPFVLGPSLTMGVQGIWAQTRVDGERSSTFGSFAQMGPGFWLEAKVTQNLEVYLSPELQFALSHRPEFVLEPLGEVHRVPVLTFLMGGGILWRF